MTGLICGPSHIEGAMPDTVEMTENQRLDSPEALVRANTTGEIKQQHQQQQQQQHQQQQGN